MIRAAVLDFDGTLIDSLTQGITLMKRIVATLGCQEPDWEYVRRRWGTYWRVLLADALPDADVEVFHEHWRVLEQECTDGYPPYPGARATVETLRARGLATALHTNRGPSGRLDDRLREANLPRTLFDVIHTPEDGTPPKPHPDSLRAVLHKLNLRDPRSAYVVSDHTDDAHMAREVGCRFIGVLTGAANRADFERFGAHVTIVDSIADVPGIVD
ncbi:MAG: Uncharacterized protein G01um101438_735 [Parcubacteria group bacterium Gr01-1014_38]|nr:MAG: Uncharacterized protein G01um101438_735 [Parcubacteria group bacterium Gr01-1014_38]